MKTYRIKFTPIPTSFHNSVVQHVEYPNELLEKDKYGAIVVKESAYPAHCTLDEVTTETDSEILVLYERRGYNPAFVSRTLLDLLPEPKQRRLI